MQHSPRPFCMARVPLLQAPQRTRIVDGEIVREDDVPIRQAEAPQRQGVGAAAGIHQSPAMIQPSRQAGQSPEVLHCARESTNHGGFFDEHCLIEQNLKCPTRHNPYHTRWSSEWYPLCRTGPGSLRLQRSSCCSAQRAGGPILLRPARPEDLWSPLPVQAPHCPAGCNAVSGLEGPCTGGRSMDLLQALTEATG